MAATTKHSGAVKEPLIHITRRSSMAAWKGILIRAAAVVIAFLLSSVLAYLLIGADPANFLKKFFEGIFGVNAMSANLRLWVFHISTILNTH